MLVMAKPFSDCKSVVCKLKLLGKELQCTAALSMKITTSCLLFCGADN